MGMDAVIYLGNYAPLLHGPPAVVVVQNLLLAVDDPAFGRAHQLYRRFALTQIARTAAAVVAISRTLAQALERREPRLRGRVRVVRPPFNVAELLRATPRFLPDAPREYFLAIGRPWDYRDYPLALRSLAESRLPHSLVIVGEASQEEREALRHEASRLQLADRLVFAGMVEDHGELRAWYEGATALLATSRLEAFGYPLGEAMALGTPIVAVRRTAFPEVVGDAGFLVEPRASDVSGALQLVVRPDERARLVELGQSRVGTVTWDSVAAELTEICREVAPKS
jgi:glycosyltransferase involved in cell wall biosynthesis